jgi:hypothetical protein
VKKPLSSLTKKDGLFSLVNGDSPAYSRPCLRSFTDFARSRRKGEGGSFSSSSSQEVVVETHGSSREDARASHWGRFLKTLFFTASALALSLSFGSAFAQRVPVQAPPTPPIVAAQDIAYPGVLKLSVDATDLDRRIFQVRETMPVAKAGPMTILYPQWVPGGHSPRNDLDKMAGLVITAGGKTLPWTRDPVAVHAFHIDVPEGATEIEISFQFLTP